MEVERRKMQQVSEKVMGWMEFPTSHFRVPNWEHWGEMVPGLRTAELAWH